jgi:O-antigen ligase
MMIFLGLLISIMTAGDIFGISWSIGPGLSLKNLLIYLAATGLLLQAILVRPPKMELKGILVCFAVLIGYAAISLMVVASSGKYPLYSVVQSLIFLKGSLADWVLLFLVMFYGSKNAQDASKLIAVLLAAIGIAQIATLWNASGLPQIGADVMNYENDRRVNGHFGHANETGSMTAALIPAYIVAVMNSSGFRRAVWVAFLVASSVVFVATLSRGATVGFVVGGLWATYLCRKYLSLGRAIIWSIIIAAVAVPVLFLAGSGYLTDLIARFTGVSAVSAADISSGRTEIWGQAFDVLATNPLYLITGVGWNTWAFSGFIALAHNQYLSIYFELGIVGLVTFMLLLRTTIVAALRAAGASAQAQRGPIIALVYSGLILSVAIIFATLLIPWFYLWIYIGLSLRYALSMSKAEPQATKTVSTGAGIARRSGSVTRNRNDVQQAPRTL